MVSQSCRAHTARSDARPEIRPQRPRALSTWHALPVSQPGRLRWHLTHRHLPPVYVQQSVVNSNRNIHAQSPAVPIRRLHALREQQVSELADVLCACVNGGASVGFMAPLSIERAKAFWNGVGEGVGAGRRAILVAEDGGGICGTVQLVLDMPDNQPHRADLCKMLVHPRARRRGLGEALMTAAVRLARECGRTLLVLDAVTDGDAARLYARLGWVRVGDIPNYAVMPDGTPCGTTYFYRWLG